MATFQTGLAGGYTLRLTVNVYSQDAKARTTTYSWSLQIIKGSGSGKWASGQANWSVRSPHGTVVGSGSISGYNFNDYTTLTLGSGRVTFGGDAARAWWGIFDDIAGYGELGGGTTTGTLTPPKLPPTNPPAAPSDLSISRTSDTQMVLGWTRNGTYTSVQIWRGTTSSNMVLVGTASGNAYTWTDRSTNSNSQYYYKVRGANANGWSGFSGTSGPLITTPAAPTGVSAVRSGASIVVDASGLPPYAASYDIEDNGTVVATSVKLPWTHAAPSARTPHTYKVRAKAGGLTGAWSTASPTVYIPAPPAAPTNLSPNGGMVGAGDAVPFSWRHNPVDASAQTVAEVKYRVDAAAWQTITVTGAVQETVLPVGAGSLEWQVRTRGGHATFSPWSAVAASTVIVPPDVSILVPGETHDMPTLEAQWETFQTDGFPQSLWLVELRSVAEVVESQSGSGATSKLALRTRLPDGATYQLAIRVATAGVWSEWAVQDFLVEYVPPAEPAVTVGWNEDHGNGALSIEPGEPVDVNTPETVSVTVERSFDGEVWELVASNVGPIVQINDWECVSNGETFYRVTAFAAHGASAVTAVTLVADSWAVWLGVGPGYSLTARLPFDPEVGVDAKRVRTQHRFEGRALPVAYSSPYVERSVNHSGRILDGEDENASRAELLAIAQFDAAVHLYRDPSGARLYGVLGDLSLDREFDGIWKYGFTVEETERA